MSTLALTLILAFVIIIIAFAGLGLSWLIKGKSSIRPGTCGRDPTKSREDSCGSNTSCSLCEPHKDNEPKS